jgi:hypothetical protein
MSQRKPGAQSNEPDSLQRKNTQPAAIACSWRSLTIGPASNTAGWGYWSVPNKL